MAIRIPIGGGLVAEVDTAREVKELLPELGVAVLGTSERRLLTTSLPEQVIEVERPRRRKARGRPVGKRSPRPARMAPPPPPARSAPAQASAGVDGFGDLATRITVALADGPESGEGLAKRLKVTTHTVRTVLDRLARTGIVHGTSAGRWRRWHLGKGSARRAAKPDTEGD